MIVIKRIISLFLAIAISLVALVVPVHAVVPPAVIAYSALASYVASTGYRLYQDQGVGETLYTALSSLYDNFLDSTDPVGALTLDGYLQSGDIFVDNNGSFVVKKAAVDIFQQFSDWIQTEYSVPVGSETPTQVISSSGLSGDGTFSVPSQYFVASSGFLASIADRVVTKTYNGASAFCIYRGTNGFYNPFIASTDPNAIYIDGVNPAGNYFSLMYDNVRVYYYATGGRSGKPNIVTGYPIVTFDIQPNVEQILRYIGFDVVNTDTSSGVKGLGVTLAKDVVDQAAKAGEDDAVVIGVGAQAGVQPGELADIVAQGLLEGTLNPSVTVTADVVIDTPVQPYPDIDGLGLPELGLALVNRFPFCIPWDFVETVRLLNADPVAPDILIDLFPSSFKSKVGIAGDTSFRLNLGSEQYSRIGVYCRWASLISFCLFLALLTKRIVWTA